MMYCCIFAGVEHIIYDTAYNNLPADKRTQLLDLLTSGRSNIIVITTPAQTSAEISILLKEVSRNTDASVTKMPQLAAGTASTVTPGAFHRLYLPDLLTAHNDNTQGFTGIQGSGTTVTRAADDGTVTAVQWDVPSHTTTLLGYWRSDRRVVYIKPATQSPVYNIDLAQREEAVGLLAADPDVAVADVTVSALPTSDPFEVDTVSGKCLWSFNNQSAE